MASPRRPMIEISIPVGYTDPLSPEENQYALALDPQVVQAYAQEWGVLPHQAFSFHLLPLVLPLLVLLLLLVMLLLCVVFTLTTMITIITYSRFTVSTIAIIINSITIPSITVVVTIS